MKRILFAILLLCLLLGGCTAQPEQTQPETTVQPETVQSSRPDVSSGAVEDFMLPLTENSWDREYPAEYVMIHFTSAVVPQPEDPYDLEAIRKIFTDYGVSIHYIIDRDGTVYCYIPESRVAWHAGVGTYAQDEKYTNKMNSYAIGIELLAMGTKEEMADYLKPEEYDALDSRLLGYTDAQYTALNALVRDICSRNHIPMDREHILGHQDYSPGKNDPGVLFDWNRLLHSPG